MPGTSKALVNGARLVAPTIPGVIPFGMIYGVAAADVGLSWDASLAMSALIFAGAAQLATLQLLDSGASAVVIIATAAVINLRMAVYSASIAPHFRHVPATKRAFLSYFLVDQAYAVSIVHFTSPTHPSDEPKHLFFLGAGLILWVTWHFSVIAGAVLGAGIPPAWALDFTIPLCFMALLVPALTDRPMIVAAAVGGGVAVIAGGLPYNLGLGLGAACGIAAGTAYETATGFGDEEPLNDG